MSLPVNGGVADNILIHGFQDFGVNVGIEQSLIHRDSAALAAPP